jgi:hypothetical protein
MKCAEYRKQAAGLYAESGEFAKHMLTCKDCQQFLDTQLSLDAAFRDVAATADAGVHNDKIEAVVLAEFDRVLADKNGSVQTRPYLKFGVVFVCSLCLIMALLLVNRQRSLSSNTKTSSRGQAEQFTAVPYVVPLAPYERVEVVRMQVSLAALTSLGFEVHGPDVSGSVMADVECGEDGRVVAISLLQNSKEKVNRRVN